MKSHRLNPDASNNTPYDDVAGVGADDRTFPTGVNHVINHTVAGSHPLPETKVGPFIKDVGDGASVFHGVEPSVTRETVESEYNARQKEATFIPGSSELPDRYTDPVPVVIVPPGVGPNSIRKFTATNATVPQDTPYLLTPRNYDQTRVLLQNEEATNYCRIATNIGGAQYGYKLAPGAVLEIYCQEAIYALGINGTVKVSILVEYGVNE